MDQGEIIQHLEDIKDEIQRTEDLSEDLHDLSKALDRLIYQVENLDENQSEIESDLEDLDEKVRSVQKDIARLNPEQLRGRISSLESEIKSISEKGASIDWQENTERRLSNLEEKEIVEWKPLIRYAMIIGFFVGLIVTLIGWWINSTGAN